MLDRQRLLQRRRNRKHPSRSRHGRPLHNSPHLQRCQRTLGSIPSDPSLLLLVIPFPFNLCARPTCSRRSGAFFRLQSLHRASLPVSCCLSYAPSPSRTHPLWHAATDTYALSAPVVRALDTLRPRRRRAAMGMERADRLCRQGLAPHTHRRVQDCPQRVQ